jgi:chorismate dehydratase
LERIITKDNSVTFHNEKFDESYHCLAGAASEARIKFVEPCKIKELAKKGYISILDVCFGLGYNSAAAIDEALKVNPNCKIKIIGLENDEKLFELVKMIKAPFKSYKLIQKLDKFNLLVIDNNIQIKIILGDARETIKKLDEKFHAVFLDPFSPKKCPELWTLDFFKDIKAVMKPGSILAT